MCGLRLFKSAKRLPVIIIITVLLISFTVFAGCNFVRPQSSKAIAVDPSGGAVQNGAVGRLPVEQGTVTVELSMVGDIMVHMPQVSAAYDKATGQYSFDNSFAEVKNYLGAADLTIGNMETTLAGQERGFSGYPQFNSPSEILTALKDTGFDVLTTANNHAMDTGKAGVLKTIAHLDAAGIKHTGTFSSVEEREEPLVVEIKGVKIAILAYTYGTNGIPVPKNSGYLVNLIDMEQVRKDVQKARRGGADVVLVLPHSGVEYKRIPGQAEEKLVDNLFGAGADIVIGSHPHVIQLMGRRDLTKDRQGLFAAYSMGNFISAQRGMYKDSGLILNLKLEKDLASGHIRLDGAEYLPTWVHKYRGHGKTLYRVVAVEKAIRDFEQGRDKSISADDYKRLKQVWKETTDLLSGPNGPAVRHI